MVQKQFARRRELYAPAVTVEQAAGEVFFKAFDAGTGRGRGNECLASTLGHAGGFGNMDKQTQVNEIKVHG